MPENQETSKAGRKLNHYQLLKTSPEELKGMPPEEANAYISRKFRSVSRDYHPDKNPGDLEKAELFKQLSSAREILEDSSKRAFYDGLMSDTENQDVLADLNTGQIDDMMRAWQQYNDMMARQQDFGQQIKQNPLLRTISKSLDTLENLIAGAVEKSFEFIQNLFNKKGSYDIDHSFDNNKSQNTETFQKLDPEVSQDLNPEVLQDLNPEVLQALEAIEEVETNPLETTNEINAEAKALQSADSAQETRGR
jgi:curved DNA-binding protein CbpA